MGTSNKEQTKDNLQERANAKKSLKKKYALAHILGESRLVNTLHQKLDRISACDVNVLISGESGVGKEPAARAIHYLSRRAGKPFITVNCGAIPANLFENELFGHEKGAFTDAAKQQKGFVEEAEGGTLFLDEIGVIDLQTQVKLLRLLQYKEFNPLGNTRAHTADIRIITATNEDLPALVKNKTFREDLFYRLNIVSLTIPPLRDRKEDIPVLVRHFLPKYSRQYNKPVPYVSAEAMDMLVNYNWPGNIRELENKIQQAIVLATGREITPADLPFKETEYTQQTATGEIENFNLAKKRMINNFEKDYLIKLLTRFNGNVTAAAAKAGKSRTALWNLLTKHKLHPGQFCGNAVKRNITVF